jgi:hypothetical protein
VKPVVDTVKPTLITAVFNMSSVPLVPAVPSITQAAALVVILNHVAVPANSPVVLAGNVGDNTPDADAGAKGVPSVNSASLLVAVPPAAGCVPSYIWSFPALPTAVVIESFCAFLSATL